ncbi:hypothetical protein PoB_003083900 [Plakobranchus ocellatus]|uniref:Secreted protein n=1 Tax=Plakobranchus ocellatus TaxID=259542 RepID=A0AAV4ADM3_9GAST|nr:hypothetical protein PoB_003083900 [Plakobranchus ocellatus]
MNGTRGRLMIFTTTVPVISANLSDVGSRLCVYTSTSQADIQRSFISLQFCITHTAAYRSHFGSMSSVVHATIFSRF